MIGMTRKAQEILVWSLLGSLVGALIFIGILESQGVTNFWMGVSVPVWLITSLFDAFCVNKLSKTNMYRAEVFFLGLFAPVVAFLAILLILIIGFLELVQKTGRVGD